MKVLDLLYKFMIMFVVALLAAVMVIKYYSYKTPHQTLYVVDLARISNAENMVAIKSQKNSSWMDVVNNASKNVKRSIQNIAGNHIVIIKQSVISGTGDQVDITDDVLRQLSLPLKTPAYIPPKKNTLLGIQAQGSENILNNMNIFKNKNKNKNKNKKDDSLFPD